MTLQDIIWLREAEVERLIDLDELLLALTDGFRSMSAGEVLGPAEIAVQRGFLMPGHLALMCLFDPEIGATKAAN